MIKIQKYKDENEIIILLKPEERNMLKLEDIFNKILEKLVS